MEDERLEAEEESPPRSLLRRILMDWVLPILAVAVVFHGIGQWRAPDLPDAAPDFELETLDGDRIQLSSLQGTPVVLNFWATWCAPCRVEVPTFSRFAKNNPDIPVLGIAADGPAGKLRKAAKDLGINYTVLQGTDEVLRAYGVDTFPTTVVVGADGRVLDAHTGIMTPPQLALAVRE